MPQLLETHRDQFVISTDPARLDINAIADMLSRAYWARGRTPEVIVRYLQHSLAFGMYQQFGWSLLANSEHWMEKLIG